MLLRWTIQCLGRGYILRNIDEYRTFAAGVRDMKGFMNDARKIFNIAHQIAVLRNRHRNACNIRFLESIGSNQAGKDIAGDYHQWNRVHKSGRDPGYQIGCSRTGGCNTYARFAACSGIAVSRMNRALLMPCQDMLEIIEAMKSIVDVQYRTARVTEDGIHPFHYKTAQQDFGTRNHLGILPFLT
ncbi:hypothetical protein D3C73_649620 [compost metagenome]